MTIDFDLWTFDDDGRWSKIAMTHTPDTADDDEEPEMPYFENEEVAAKWIISVLADGRFSICESDPLLTSRKEPFATLEEAVAFCDAIDEVAQYGPQRRSQPQSSPAAAPPQPTAQQEASKKPKNQKQLPFN